MSGSRDEKMVRRAVAKIQARLGDLARTGGGRFVWINGVIRHYELHPTKGWRGRRVERFDVTFEDGTALAGEVRLSDDWASRHRAAKAEAADQIRRLSGGRR